MIDTLSIQRGHYFTDAVARIRVSARIGGWATSLLSNRKVAVRVANVSDHDPGSISAINHAFFLFLYSIV
jgi:hypothetical protein